MLDNVPVKPEAAIALFIVLSAKIPAGRGKLQMGGLGTVVKSRAILASLG